MSLVGRLVKPSWKRCIDDPSAVGLVVKAENGIYRVLWLDNIDDAWWTNATLMGRWSEAELICLK